MRTLQKALHDGDGQILQSNIPEYLVYASKRYCNYKAIVSAIEQSCDDIDVKFYMVNLVWIFPLTFYLELISFSI